MQLRCILAQGVPLRAGTGFLVWLTEKVQQLVLLEADKLAPLEDRLAEHMVAAKNPSRTEKRKKNSLGAFAAKLLF